MSPKADTVAPAASTHTITISVSSGEIVVAPPSLIVDKNDKIEWTSAEIFSIEFGGISPTKNRKGKKDMTGKVKMDVRGDVGPGVYKYTVAVASGGEVLIRDPEIIIDVV